MSELFYKYNPGDIVWIRHDGEVKKCTVCRAVFEVDPSLSGVTEEKDYHLDIVGDNTSKIVIRAEPDVYETALDAIEKNSPTNPLKSITYDFDVNSTAWSYTGEYIDFEATVTQITINLVESKIEILYHLLATNGEYRTLIHDSDIVFATQQEALDAIAAIITPTPTMTATPTLTPTETPEITPTITPTIMPSQTVTPNPTVTPTQSG
jgi:hypothetical protein